MASGAVRGSPVGQIKESEPKRALVFPPGGANPQVLPHKKLLKTLVEGRTKGAKCAFDSPWREVRVCLLWLEQASAGGGKRAFVFPPWGREMGSTGEVRVCLPP